jgi:archaellum component FlaC
MDRSGQIPLTIDKYDPELYTRVCKLGDVTTNNDELRAEYQKGNIKRADREKLMTHFVDRSTQAVITAKIEKLDGANGQLNEINNDLRSSNHQIRNYHKSMAGIDESLK